MKLSVVRRWRQWIRPCLLAAPAVAASAGLLLWSTGFGVFLVLVGWAAFASFLLGPRGLAWLWQRVPEWVRRLAGEWSGPLVVLAIIGAAHPFLVRLDPPTSHDHPIHLAKAVWTANELLPWAFAGWSDAAELGWPLNVLYPPGTSLLPALIQEGTFGLLGWTRAYALALLIGLSLTPLAVYFLARRPLGRAGATVAALASLAARGGWYQGGFEFDVDTGVWGTAASVGLAGLAIAALPRVVRGDRWATAGCAAALGGAVLFHPFAVVVVALFGGARLFQLCALSDDQGAPPAGAQGLLRALLAAGLGALLSAWWWLPFAMRAGEYAHGLGHPWKPIGQMSADLLGGTLFTGTPAILVGLGLAGLALGAARRKPLLLAAAASFALTLVVASHDAAAELGLTRLLPGMVELQFERFAYLLKLLLWLGVAELAGELWAALRSPSAPAARRPAAAALGACAAVLLAAMAARGGPSPGWPPFVFPATVSSDARVQHWRAAGEAIRRHLAEGHFFRTVLEGVDMSDHSTLWAVVFGDGFPATRTTWHAAELFRYDATGLDPAMLRAQDVRFILTPHAHPQRTDLKKVAQYGALFLFERADWSPDERAHLVNARGQQVAGRVEVLRFAPEEIRVRVSGAPEDAVLLLHRAPWATWEAFRDGQPVSWTKRRVADSPRASVVALPGGNGEYLLRDAGGAPERLSRALTVLGLVAIFVPWLSRRPLGQLTLRRLAARLAPALTPALVLVALLAVLVLGLGVFGLRAGRFDLLARLESASVRLGGKECPLQRGGLGFLCGEQHWEKPNRVMLTWEGWSVRCVWAAPTKGKPLELSFAGVKLGREFLLRHALAEGTATRGVAPAATIRVEIEGLPSTLVQREDQSHWREERIDTRVAEGEHRSLRLTIETESDTLRHLCLNGRVEP